MRDFKHWPLLLAVFAVIATQIACTWWSSHQVTEAIWDSENRADYEKDFSRVRDIRREIAKSTDSIDSRLMTPGERLQDQRASLELQRSFDELMKPKKSD